MITNVLPRFYESQSIYVQMILWYDGLCNSSSQGDWACQLGEGKLWPHIESTPYIRSSTNFSHCRRPLHLSQIWSKSVHAGRCVNRWSITKIYLFSYSFICLFIYFAGSIARSANLPVFSLLRGRFWGFSPRRGDMLHRWGWNLANFTSIGAMTRV